MLALEHDRAVKKGRRYSFRCTQHLSLIPRAVVVHPSTEQIGTQVALQKRSDDRARSATRIGFPQSGREQFARSY